MNKPATVYAHIAVGPEDHWKAVSTFPKGGKIHSRFGGQSLPRWSCSSRLCRWERWRQLQVLTRTSASQKCYGNLRNYHWAQVDPGKRKYCSNVLFMQLTRRQLSSIWTSRRRHREIERLFLDQRLDLINVHCSSFTIQNTFPQLQLTMPLTHTIREGIVS